MSRSGWVPHPREWEEHPVITKDLEHYRIWGYLINNAAYKRETSLLGGKPVTLEPGQLTTGRKQIALNTKINESKVQRILNLFESAHLIKQQTTNKNRLITILCWRELQNIEQHIDRQMIGQRTSSDRQLPTLEHRKNITSLQQSNQPDCESGVVDVDIDDLWEFCWENERYDIDVDNVVAKLKAGGFKDSNGVPIKNIKKYLMALPRGERVQRPRPKRTFVSTGEFEGYWTITYRGKTYKEEDFPADKRWW